jgi:transcriptional regulator with XRE-family HTH domain
MKSTIGATIAQLRGDKGLSQEALADLCGVHRTYISQLERGLKNPTLNVLQKISKALDVPLSELIERYEQNK